VQQYHPRHHAEKRSEEGLPTAGQPNTAQQAARRRGARGPPTLGHRYYPFGTPETAQDMLSQVNGGFRRAPCVARWGCATAFGRRRSGNRVPTPRTGRGRSRGHDGFQASHQCATMSYEHGEDR
jgi:hypothetical protein